MINKILRILILCFGMALSLDALLPTKKYELQIDHQGISSNLGKDYKVYFHNSQLSACGVDRHYDQLKDNDAVMVHTARITKICVAIEKDGIGVYRSSFWRLLAFVGGLIFSAYAIGWYEPKEWSERWWLK